MPFLTNHAVCFKSLPNLSEQTPFLFDKAQWEVQMHFLERRQMGRTILFIPSQIRIQVQLFFSWTLVST